VPPYRPLATRAHATATATLIALLQAGVALTVTQAPAPQAAAAEAVTYEPPVDAPVSDAFRPPRTRFGRGNRGVEYDTDVGEAVVAAAAGVVAFAGQVGGPLHVTVQHADGLRTTYGPLAGIGAGVAQGRRLEAGGVVGTAGDHLLWTARLGTAYVDPAVLLAASAPPSVRLVANRRR
jgi:murein DD-endopeptidase MepM/ murein hydrolase activator NlpD